MNDEEEPAMGGSPVNEIKAVAVIPKSQLWTLDEPHRSRIVRGLAWAAENEPREASPSLLLRNKRNQRNPRPR